MKKTMKKNRIWYRKPKERIVIEHLFLDGDSTISIIESVEGENPWVIPSSEKVRDLMIYAQDNLGLKFLSSRRISERVPGVLTKKQQAIENFNNQFRQAIFCECGAQQYL